MSQFANICRACLGDRQPTAISVLVRPTNHRGEQARCAACKAALGTNNIYPVSPADIEQIRAERQGSK